MKPNNNRGFTLIELLTVITIIAILAIIAMVILQNAQARGRDTQRISQIKQIETALESYYNEYGGYPVVATPLDLGLTNSNCLAQHGFYSNSSPSCDNTSLIRIIPSTPTTKPNDFYRYTSLGSDGVTPCTSGTACELFKISFIQETKSTGLSIGTHVLTPSGIQ